MIIGYLFIQLVISCHNYDRPRINLDTKNIFRCYGHVYVHRCYHDHSDESNSYHSKSFFVHVMIEKHLVLQKIDFTLRVRNNMLINKTQQLSQNIGRYSMLYLRSLIIISFLSFVLMIPYVEYSFGESGQINIRIRIRFEHGRN